jgi:hypothetical protein
MTSNNGNTLSGQSWQNTGIAQYLNFCDDFFPYLKEGNITAAEELLARAVVIHEQIKRANPFDGHIQILLADKEVQVPYVRIMQMAQILKNRNFGTLKTNLYLENAQQILGAYQAARGQEAIDPVSMNQILALGLAENENKQAQTKKRGRSDQV